MNLGGRFWAKTLRGVGAAVLAASLCACGGTVSSDSAPPPFFAVLSAFPAETAPLLDQASIDGTMMINGRDLRIGTLAGVHVVIGLTGIGLVNATTTTRALLDQFAVTGIVFSGVAGTTLRIGDVAVPATWSLKDGTAYPANQEWLDLAGTIVAPAAGTLDHCTVVPASGESVCLPFDPVVVVGGVGESSDPFGGRPVLCRANGDDVFGCDVPPEGAASVATRAAGEMRTVAPADAAAPIVDDMETAAVAREAAARGLPFIGFRATSDGADDPLGLPGFPAQFFAYYRLAARNAADAAVAFLKRVATVAP